MGGWAAGSVGPDAGVRESAGVGPGTWGFDGDRLPPKRNLFGIGVSWTDSYPQVARCVVEAGRAERPLMVSSLSAHALVLGAGRVEMARALALADIVTTDGQPVRWALNALHLRADDPGSPARLERRVCGPELMLEVCAACAREGLPIYLYGSRPAVLKPLAANLRARFPRLAIAGVDPSRVRPKTFPPPTDEPDDRRDVARIQASGARVVFVGLGCPLQELWVATHKRALGMPALCVGAAFDFHAGLLARAPQAMQDRGLEWLFRLSRDPRRLLPRYARYNTEFLLRFGLAWLRRAIELDAPGARRALPLPAAG
jgi:exopolysaccharide biosynthesis WecB/TagA/CpsF family protein